MGTGAITGYIDVAQIALYVFWGFFAALIYYLHQEDKREGYPLESDRSDRVVVQGWPPIPKPKSFLLRDGRVVMVPNAKVSAQAINAAPVAPHLGAALAPIGDPMLAAVGPGSYADRSDLVDLTLDDLPRIVPLRSVSGCDVASDDPDPRGLPVVGADGVVGGTVRDLWIDRSDAMFRYLELEVPGAERRVLLPINFTRVSNRQVSVVSILGQQFAQVPLTRDPDLITLLEEDKIMAYYGGGTLYATPQRQEPLL